MLNGKTMLDAVVPLLCTEALFSTLRHTPMFTERALSTGLLHEV
jgi:hypothetical protein